MEKTVYLEEWKQRIENENIKVLKNWYTNNNQMECIMKFSNLRGNNVKINYFNMGIEERNLKICNLVFNQETTYDGYVIGKIVYYLNENEEIIKFVVDNSTFIIPWMSLDVLDSEWNKRIKK